MTSGAGATAYDEPVTSAVGLARILKLSVRSILTHTDAVNDWSVRSTAVSCQTVNWLPSGSGGVNPALYADLPYSWVASHGSGFSSGKKYPSRRRPFPRLPASTDAPRVSASHRSNELPSAASQVSARSWR